MKKAVFISLVIAVLITACGPLKAARNKSFLDEFVPAYKEYMEFYIQLVEHHYNAAQAPSILYDDTWSREVIDLASGLDNAAKEINDMPVLGQSHLN